MNSGGDVDLGFAEVNSVERCNSGRHRSLTSNRLVGWTTLAGRWSLDEEEKVIN